VNKKAQALVEFVLILPVIIFFIFIVIDFSNVFYNKNRLENLNSEITEYMAKGKTFDEAKNILPNDITSSFVDSGSNKKIILEKDIDFVTPFVFRNGYHISSERVVLNE
jgi:Flp pilus assembly protein TadG